VPKIEQFVFVSFFSQFVLKILHDRYTSSISSDMHVLRYGIDLLVTIYQMLRAML